jgi:hypothetical protein
MCKTASYGAVRLYPEASVSGQIPPKVLRFQPVNHGLLAGKSLIPYKRQRITVKRFSLWNKKTRELPAAARGRRPIVLQAFKIW